MTRQSPHLCSWKVKGFFYLTVTQREHCGKKHAVMVKTTESHQEPQTQSLAKTETEHLIFETTVLTITFIHFNNKKLCV